MHEYPTLVREVVTSTLPAFATACLQILKPAVSTKAGKTPFSLIETIFDGLSTLIPLHPTTLRQFAGKIRAETRIYLAPTSADSILVPTTLQRSSRRLAIRLHMMAVKGGDSTEWTKHVGELVIMLHSTADQVFRAVQEKWESTANYKAQPVNVDVEPQGGGEDIEHLPCWVGVQAGGERLIGLLDFIGDYLRLRTRAAVTVPITALLDVTSRISSIKLPLPGKEKVESGHMNPAIGREERDELWAVFPDIQVAAMRMHIALVQRLEKNYIPLAQEALDQVLRILQSTYRLPQARLASFLLIKEILHLCGPTLPKLTVESLGFLIKCCCRDLLGAAGYLKKPRPQGSTVSQNGQKSKTLSQNADAFLPSKAQDDMMSVSLDANHHSVARALLATLFSHLPQHYIPSSLRSQMLKVAILDRNKDAQVASILHPARDRSGRTPQVILPYLAQQFPQDESVEILRFNFRPTATGLPSNFMGTDDGMIMEEDEEIQTDTMTTGFSFEQALDSQFSSTFTAPAPITQPKPLSPIPMRGAEPFQTPFLAQPPDAPTQPESKTAVVQHSPAPASSLKRKNEDATVENSFSKRVEIDTDTASLSMPSAAPVVVGHSNTTATITTNVAAATAAVVTGQLKAVQDEEDESDDESVHLNMELDSSDDEYEDADDE
ncbi:rRNA processing/ribosome biogenesis-domain-containing protein [Xylariaceae sp. FL1651]|nr:rRNA processing/ribosome biogenesis-domain-containing protein [Xylariaceae sp. FL1651]